MAESECSTEVSPVSAAAPVRAAAGGIHCLGVVPGRRHYDGDAMAFEGLTEFCSSVTLWDHHAALTEADWQTGWRMGATAAPKRLARWKKLAAAVREFDRSHRGPKIVHDLLVGRAALFLRRRMTLRRRKDVRTVLTLVSPNPGWLFERRWNRGDEMKVSWGELFSYYLPWAIRVVAAEYPSCRMADGLVGRSEQIVEEALRYYRLADRQVMVMPSPVDTAFWCPAEAAAEPASERYLLYVGNVTRRKGFDLVLGVLARAKAAYPGIRLKVAGDLAHESGRPWFRPILDAEGLERDVDLLGVVDQSVLRDLYRGAWAMICPSFDEGSPRVVKEAAACGCPVVVSRIPGTRVIDPAGEFLRFFDAFEADRVWEKMEELLASPSLQSEWSRIGRGKMVEQFSARVCAARLAEFYERLFGLDEA